MSEDNGQIIEHGEGEPSFFAMIPKMAMMDLDPYELALYCNYKMTAMENGACWKSNATVSRETGMSDSKMRQTRLQLVAKGFIQLTQETDNPDVNTPPIITIVNVWAENYERYAVSENNPLPLENMGGAAQKQPPATRKHQRISNELNAGKKKGETRKSATTSKRPKDRNKWTQDHLTAYEEEFPDIKRFAALDNALEPSLSQLTRLTALDCVALFEEMRRFPSVDLKKLFDYAGKRDNPKGYNTFKWMLYSLDSFIKVPATNQPKEYAAPYHKPIVIEENPDAIPMPQEAKDAIQMLKDKMYVKDGYHAAKTTD